MSRPCRSCIPTTTSSHASTPFGMACCRNIRFSRGRTVTNTSADRGTRRGTFPQGPTEEHLVEELAGIIWRKRRRRLAEAAAHHRALKRSTDPYRETAKAALIHVATHDEDEIGSVDDAIRATEQQTVEDCADLESDQAMTEKALALLKN